MWFEALSDFKVNVEKSEIILVGRVDNIKELAQAYGCRVDTLSSSYLGLPLGATFKSVIVWYGIEERFCKRLTLWKRQYISKGSRLTLTHSTLSSLPIYFMSLFCIPRLVRLRL